MVAGDGSYVRSVRDGSPADKGRLRDEGGLGVQWGDKSFV